MRPHFFGGFDNSENNDAIQKLGGYTTAIITAMLKDTCGESPGPRPPDPQARLQGLQNSGRQMFMLRVKPESELDYH